MGLTALIIPFFATFPKLIQHSPFTNFGKFCQSPLLFRTPRLLIHVHSRGKVTKLFVVHVVSSILHKIVC